MEAAIKLNFGFTQHLEPGASIGFYELYKKLALVYPSRTDTWLGMRQWNESPKRSAHVILDNSPVKIIDVNFSWANGYAIPRYAKALANWGRPIHLLIMVDPVFYRPPRWATSSLWRSNKPFIIPHNVRRVVSIQTANKANWNSPWGCHPLKCKNGNTRVTQIVVFGSNHNLKYADHATRVIVDPTVTHENIDQDRRTHDFIIKAIRTEIQR